MRCKMKHLQNLTIGWDINMIIGSLALSALVIGFGLGYFSKGINITITKPDVVEKDENGNVKYNESLVDMLPPQVRQEIEQYNKGVNV